MRPSTLLFHLTQRLLYTKWRDPGEEPKLHLFGQLKRITTAVARRPAWSARAAPTRRSSCTRSWPTWPASGSPPASPRRFVGERPIKALLDPYNPTGSTAPRPLQHLAGPTAGRPTPRAATSTGWSRQRLGGRVLPRRRGAPAGARLREEPQPRLRGAVPLRLRDRAATCPTSSCWWTTATATTTCCTWWSRSRATGARTRRRRRPTMDTYWVPGVNHLEHASAAGRSPSSPRSTRSRPTSRPKVAQTFDEMIEARRRPVRRTAPGPRSRRGVRAAPGAAGRRSVAPASDRPSDAGFRRGRRATPTDDQLTVARRLVEDHASTRAPDHRDGLAERHALATAARRHERAIDSVRGTLSANGGDAMAERSQAGRRVETLRHDEASAGTSRPPSTSRCSEAEHLARQAVRYTRNRDLDPQLVWRGKDEQDWSDLVVQAPPLYIQEKVHPKALIDDLLRQSRRARKAQEPGAQIDLFADFNGIAEGRRPDRVLPARPELVEPDDPGRLAPGDGEPRRARGPARQGAVHLHRPAVRHQVQLELPVVARPAAT